ncbi:thiopeptide-type bacteriocin biosynthesis protein [Streptomyces sp. NPDC051636]|uniref:thiopeptide-type bacteriocin biosynthesis protein n=1 Tax=Streptomyces sp. NPDC051636 TaxID=3365663 RepID=UPI0037B520F9
MPADRLTSRDRSPLHQPDPGRVESAVMRVLTGTAITDAASSAGLDPAELTTAVALYRQAGRDALHQQTARTCWQAYIEFDDWSTAETVAALHLAPALHEAESNGAAWWFIRKYPCWRLRIHHDPRRGDSPAMVIAALDALTSSGEIKRWWRGLYEPEVPAFGGHGAMAAAHALFHADSRAILDHATDQPWPLGRRELSVLLCTTMFHAAGLEWYEMGDVWEQVSQERALPNDLPEDWLPRMGNNIRQLLLADTEPAGALFRDGGPGAFAARWGEAFRQAGADLGAGARAGELERGIRRVLAYHVIFHWNRLGLTAGAQAVLARAAAHAVLGGLGETPEREAFPPGAEVVPPQHPAPTGTC